MNRGADLNVTLTGRHFNFPQVEARGYLVVVLLRVLPLAVNHIGGKLRQTVRRSMELISPALVP
jgi:hypothetical protein